MHRIAFLLLACAVTAWADPPPRAAEKPTPPAAPVAPEKAAEKPAPTAAVPPAKAKATPEKPANAVPLKDIREFTAVYSLVKQAYVDPVDDPRLMQSAIRGLLSGLDPHSQYLDEKQVQSLSEDTSGSYAGLGIEVMQVDGTLRVIAPIDDTPAARGGIRPGDLIIRIDGKPVQSDDLDRAVESLRGKAGSKIVLSIVHENERVPVDITLVREVIRVASARGRLLEPGFAYFRVGQFQAETGAQLRRAIEKAAADQKTPLRGAILDVRSNPGGLLTAAIEISDLFLDDGVIVSTRGRVPNANQSFRATPGDILAGAPLVVLVDHGTASAAEIVAGALKDHHRALAMGRRTFGKGSVQSVLPLDATRAIKLTTARYYTPNGTSIQAAGIQPDIALADLALSTRQSENLPVIGERDLPNHLRGNDETTANAAASSRIDEALQKDYALGEALTVLKALALRAPPPASVPPAGVVRTDKP